MAKRIDTQARIEAVRLQDQGSPPAAPAAGYSLVFAKADGLYLETSAGAIVGPFITGSAVGSGRTLIEEKTPSETGTVVFSSIPGTYKKLTIEFAARSTQAATSVTMTINLNGDSTASNYRSSKQFAYAAGTAGTNCVEGLDSAGSISAGNSPTGSFSMGIFEFIQYANTTFNTQVIMAIGGRLDASASHEITLRGAGEWENSAAVTQIALILSAGNYTSGSVFRLYGEI